MMHFMANRWNMIPEQKNAGDEYYFASRGIYRMVTMQLRMNGKFQDSVREQHITSKHRRSLNSWENEYLHVLSDWDTARCVFEVMQTPQMRWPMLLMNSFSKQLVKNVPHKNVRTDLALTAAMITSHVGNPDSNQNIHTENMTAEFKSRSLLSRAKRIAQVSKCS